MKMIRTQSLFAVGLGLARCHAFVVPAGVSIMRAYSSALTKGAAVRSQQVSAGHGRTCGCSKCAGVRAVSGIRMMSTTEYDQAEAGTAQPIKLYIGNLGWDTTTDDLQESFAQYGSPVDCYVVIDRATGESRGFGFVTFETEEEAQRAVQGMNGQEMDGRRIRVDISRPKGAIVAEPEGCKLYVGNLGYETSAQDLESHFSKFGTVTDITVVIDRDTGNSRGFGFCTFSSPAEASAAVEGMDGYEVDGRELRVNLSRPKAERSNDFNRGGGGGGGGGGGAVDATKIFVGNLGWETSTESLQQAFSQYGNLIDAKVVTDRDTGNSRGFGFITYESAQSAEAAITGMDGMELDGREIRVNVSQPKKPRYQESYDSEW